MQVFIAMYFFVERLYKHIDMAKCTDLLVRVQFFASVLYVK